jgi:hypothetical protein
MVSSIFNQSSHTKVSHHAGVCIAVLNDVLALHNQLRAKHSAPPLTWSTLLEQSAMAWASGCNHEHSTNRAGNYNELNAWGNRPFTQAVQDQWYAGGVPARQLPAWLLNFVHRVANNKLCMPC